MTEISYFIVERVLHNSVNVMTRQRDELGIRSTRFYTTMKWTTSRRYSRDFATTAKSSGLRSKRRGLVFLRRPWSFWMLATRWVRQAYGPREKGNVVLHW